LSQLVALQKLPQVIAAGAAVVHTHLRICTAPSTPTPTPTWTPSPSPSPRNCPCSKSANQLRSLICNIL